jgi:phage tail protein X
MLDRQKIETILTRRFTGATRGQVAAVANAIMGLGDEWEEIIGDADYLHLEDMPVPRDRELRLFRRRDA